MKRNYVVLTRWLLAGVLLPVTALTLYPTQLLSIFSDEAVSAANALIILAVAHGLYAALSASEHLLVMSGRSLLNMALGVVTLAISVAVSIPLIMLMGTVGAAIGILVAFTFLNSARVYYVHKLYQLYPFGPALVWPLLNASVVFVSFYLFNQFVQIDTLPKLVVILVLMMGMYGTLYFLGPKEPEEKHVLARIKSRLKRNPPTDSDRN